MVCIFPQDTGCTLEPLAAACPHLSLTTCSVAAHTILHEGDLLTKGEPLTKVVTIFSLQGKLMLLVCVLLSSCPPGMSASCGQRETFTAVFLCSLAFSRSYISNRREQGESIFFSQASWAQGKSTHVSLKAREWSTVCSATRLLWGAACPWALSTASAPAQPQGDLSHSSEQEDPSFLAVPGWLLV